MIEYVLLSERLVSLLLPLLPRLKTAGQGIGAAAAGALTEEFAGEAREAISTLWQRLAERFRSESRIEEAIETAAEHPEDPRTAAALSLALERLLREDEAFATGIERLLNRAERSALAQAENVTIHGDDAVVQLGKYNINIRHAGNVRLENQD